MIKDHEGDSVLNFYFLSSQITMIFEDLRLLELSMSMDAMATPKTILYSKPLNNIKRFS